ncbi:oxidoreductase [Virgibacillus indicus]|uniref:Oxidoreductase n=1 Tax=Virgibacillus indicus TaxID=2024554 RepID=A0A265N6V7_9BACI|nr:aldo/keto reductase [Virgibacillus indicus]OZU87179.1 oxidoreductase [Virgibacillus indicus]
MNEKVELGKTGLYIHSIGLGANKIAEENKETNTEYGGKVLSAAIENGLNFIDTAYYYGEGDSEEIIGKTLKENKSRDGIVIATKGAHKFTNDGVVLDNSPAFLTNAVDESLKRLQTDVIDLFYIHFPDKNTPKYEAVGALQRLKEAGKIRSIGVSNFSKDQLKEANQNGYLDVVQANYNLIDRSAEKTIFPFMLENDISFVPYYPLASGLLTGKYTKDTVISEKNKVRPQFQDDVYKKHVEKVGKLRGIAEKHDVNIHHIVLAFYLTRAPIDAVIPGARNTGQVLSNLETAAVQLTPEDIQIIENIFPLD